jgi:hypothetical protein
MRFILLAMLVGLSLANTAYAISGFENKSRVEGTTNPAMESFHSSGKDSQNAQKGIVAVIKNAILAEYNNTKIGIAFDSYSHFKSKEWHESKGENGKYYIDFWGYNPSGWFDFDLKKKGISAQGVEVKFTVYPDGAYGVSLISKFELKKDGEVVRYPVIDKKGVLDAIFTNKKIGF